MRQTVIYIAIALLGLALIAISISGEEDGFNEKKWFSYEEGKQRSVESGKKLFIFISSPTCSVCNYFKKNVFSDTDVMNFIQKNFIPVYVDVSKESPPVNVFAYPTFCVGYPENLTCFNTASRDDLINTLLDLRQ